jgi:aspartate racemase
MKKTVGILGGMGPYATLAFFKQILDMTHAIKDYDHARLVIDNHPQIPGRTRHFLYNEPSPVPGMIDACLRLQQYPVDLIAIPCNSAQAWRVDVQKAVGVPILDIIEVTTAAARDRFPEAEVLIVLGGRVTWAKRTYESCAGKHGFSYISISETLQLRVERAIEAVKIQRNLESVVDEVNSIATEARKDLERAVIVFGCTEFGCIKEKICGVQWIDSSSAYAKRVVQEAGVRCA